MRRLVFGILASSALATAACAVSSSPESSAAQNVSADANGIHFYEQAPVDAKLGQAVSIEINDAGQLSAAALSPETCVEGSTTTTRDEARATGQADVITS